MAHRRGEIPPALAAGTRPSRLPARLAMLLIASTALTFVRILPQPFAPIDDILTIAGNPRLNPPAWNSQSILWYWTHDELGLYIPVTYTAWGLLAQATWVPTADENGLHVDPAFFHTASLLAHIAAALAVYAILLRLLTALRPAGESSKPINPWPAAAGALLFALHPLQVEAVAWASGLKDVLAGGFALVAIAIYLQIERPLPTQHGAMPSSIARRRNVPFYLLATLSFLLAILSKPSAIVTPLLLAVIELILLHKPLRATAIRLAPWLILAIPIAIIAKVAQPAEGIAVPPMLQRPVVAGASIAFYLGKLLLPTGLAFDHGWRPTDMLRLTWFWWIAVIPLLIALLLFIYRRRSVTRPFTGAGLILLLSLAPVLGLTPFLYQESSTVADHYVYLAMLAPAIAAAFALHRLASASTRAGQQQLSTVSAIVLALCAGLSTMQIGYWRDPESFARRMIAVTPSSALAHNVLARHFMDQRRWPEAETELSAAIAANPNYFLPRLNLVTLYSGLGRVEESIAAMYELQRVNLLLPPGRQKKLDDMFYKAGLAALAANHPDQAVRYLDEALRQNPSDPAIPATLEKARNLLRPKR